MKRTVIILTALAIMALASPMFAATATSVINVSANVAAVCTMTTTTDLAFGAYDPVVTNTTGNPKNETAPAVLSVSCTKHSSGITLEFTTGNSGTMSGTAYGDSLTFNLFQNALHTTPFGSVAGGQNASLTFAASKGPQSVNVYGQIPGGQDVSVDAYNGTVTATVNY